MRWLPSFATLHKVWDKAAILILVLAIAVAVTAFAWAVDNSQVTRDQGKTIIAQNKTIIALSVTNKRLAKLNLTSQNNHHAATVKADQAIMAAEAVISYEGGVITFLLGEIAQGQAQGHQTLAELQTLQMEVTVELPEAVSALKTGQAQINAYLGYLTCLGTSQTAAACGAAPPLPST